MPILRRGLGKARQRLQAERVAELLVEGVNLRRIGIGACFPNLHRLADYCRDRGAAWHGRQARTEATVWQNEGHHQSAGEPLTGGAEQVAKRPARDKEPDGHHWHALLLGEAHDTLALLHDDGGGRVRPSGVSKDAGNACRQKARRV